MLLTLLAVISAPGPTLCAGPEGRQTAAAAAQRHALPLALPASAAQDQLIENTHQLLMALAQAPKVRGGDPRACLAFLAKRIKHYAPCANLDVAKPDIAPSHGYIQTRVREDEFLSKQTPA